MVNQGFLKMYDRYFDESEYHRLYDGESIIYTRKILQANQGHGYNAEESGIYQIYIDTMEIRKLAAGSGFI